MGMYTEIFVSGNVRPNTQAAQVVRWLFGGEPRPTQLPQHPFFEDGGCELIGNCASYYHQPQPVNKVWEDAISGDLHFVSLSNLKDYNGTIRKFFDWLSATGADFKGYRHYEENRAPDAWFSSEEGD